MRKAILIAALILLQSLSISAAEVTTSDRSNYMCSTNNISYLRARYKLFPSGAIYINIRIGDIESQIETNLIIDNADFASFLAYEQGLKVDKLGRFLKNDLYIKFREGDYLDFMIKNNGKVIELSIVRLQNFIGIRRFGNKGAGKGFLKKFFFDRPMQYEQLGVKNEKGLLNKFFDFNSDRGSGLLKKEYHNKYSLNPSFIATLLDIGYLVGTTDIAPLLTIHRLNY